MKGAIADPWLNIINPPKNSKTTNIGSSQNFFLTFKKSQNSFKNHIFKIASSLN